MAMLCHKALHRGLISVDNRQSNSRGGRLLAKSQIQPITMSHSSIHSIPVLLCALAYGVGSAASLSAEVIATEPVGYISTETVGGTVRSPGLTFVSPSLAQPVLWQGQVASVDGATLVVENAEWADGAFDSSYYAEIVTGAYAGMWSAIASVDGNQLTVADPIESLLAVGDTVGIRRFNTLSDFLGAENEAGLLGGREPAYADAVAIYHAGGMKIYWYYTGSPRLDAGWYDSWWKPSADVVIAPGEGVVLYRKTEEPLVLRQSGTLKTGAQGLVVRQNRNFIGGSTAVDLRLGDSGLYTGDPLTGISGGRAIDSADLLIIYGDPLQIYWYYNRAGSSLPAGWYDTWWKPADDVVIPGGSTFIIDRKDSNPFVWFAPSPVY